MIFYNNMIINFQINESLPNINYLRHHLSNDMTIY